MENKKEIVEIKPMDNVAKKNVLCSQQICNRYILGLLSFFLAIVTLSISADAAGLKENTAVRPPAVPLVVCDPYFSIWSCADTLTGDVTRHWTGRAHSLTSLVRIDGKAYRLIGADPKDTPALKQSAVNVLPTRTIYTFQDAGIKIEMTFMQAALPDNIDLMSRPVVYLTWNCASMDGKNHDVAVYFDASMEIAVNDPGQEVVWSREQIEGMDVLKAGSAEQNILGQKGDDVRIDWGYFYLAASKKEKSQSIIATAEDCRKSFVGQGALPSTMDTQTPRKVRDNAPVMAMQFNLNGISAKAGSGKTCQVILAYDDLYSVLYFGQKLTAFWKRDGKQIEQIIKEASDHYLQISRRCQQFDQSLMKDLEQAGGADYQTIGALAYRQALGANKIVADTKGMPLMFSKENFSNGCMGTVDVFYPFAPQVLLLNPTLAKASFVPILEYARSERWKFSFAPHDIGTYPHAMGQAYGGGERTEENQMPVEECGNMMLLVAAVVEAEHDIAFAKEYWDVLTKWAEYLKSKGLDPENQLCTDDFAGHLAHNVNLSAKAIVALGAYAKMSAQMGDSAIASEYRKTAEQYVKEWVRMADNGDHYRLAFDKSDTWSQKYNLVWDRVLGLNLFPPSVAKTEMAYYRKVQKTYGLPLDNRSDYTKLDWILWTASITGDKGDFEALIRPVVKFLNETPNRIPMTDWYWTNNAKHKGFQARPVVGGVFIRLMDNPTVWKKWVNQADSIKGKWAPLPKAPKIVEVVASSIHTPQQWYYVFDTPDKDWFKADFNAAGAGWKKGPAGFGTQGTPGVFIGTVWNSSDIWLQREFELKNVPQDIKLMVHHDEDAQVYLNGVIAAKLSGYTSGYETFPISNQSHQTLKPGINLIAIHCHQTQGGQYVDAGLAEVVEQK
jgi:hypothetical protein